VSEKLKAILDIINALAKAGSSVILSVGFVVLGYVYLTQQVKRDEQRVKSDEQRQEMDQQYLANMNRQTSSYEDISKFLEKLVMIYSGGTQ
jgi:hypothetical protein